MAGFPTFPAPVSGGGGGSSNATTPVDGTNLTAAASQTINPGTDKACRYTMPAATETADVTITLGTTGSPQAGLTVEIVRRDLTAHNLTINNGGTGGTTGGANFTTGISPASIMSHLFQYDGANWQYINSQVVV